MKLSTKPISSPGRTDKFPPPLMRFLRTNPGSRSRGRSRSRSSTMFLRKKNNTTIPTQEPSSPKVTCMGQVRVRRPAASSPAAPTKCHRNIWWVQNPLFCHQKINPGSSSSSSPSSCCHRKLKPVWPNWGFLFRRKAESSAEKTELNFKNKPNDEESEDEVKINVNVNSNNDFVSNSCSSSTPPPRNALLLTRCRSLPYRSSSLASGFWGSPEETGEEEQRGTELENREREFTEQDKEKPSLEQEGRKDLKLERKLKFFKELEESIRERIMESEKVRELNLQRREEDERECGAGPIGLTRCKSEPARTAQKLDPH